MLCNSIIVRLCITSTILNLLRLALWHHRWSILGNVPGTFESSVYLPSLCIVFYVYCLGKCVQNDVFYILLGIVCLFTCFTYKERGIKIFNCDWEFVIFFRSSLLQIFWISNMILLYLLDVVTFYFYTINLLILRFIFSWILI